VKKAVLVSGSVVDIHNVPNVNLLVGRLGGDDLALDVHVHGRCDVVGQVALVAEVLALAHLLVAEPAQLMCPERDDLLLGSAGNAKEIGTTGSMGEDPNVKRSSVM
jgi:hypothetical protein